MTDRIAIIWRPRASPLTPVAVAARGDVARALARRLLALDDDALSALRGVAGADVLLVAGTDLPWVDGVLYLGRDPAAAALLLPTALEPSVPAHFLERALEARFGAGPLAVLPDPPAVVAAGAVRPIARETLAAWLDEEA